MSNNKILKLIRLREEFQLQNIIKEIKSPIIM